MLKILLPDSPRDTDYLAQMHHLRYQRFVMQFGWKDGVQALNQMEFDEYDYSAPLYLANVGDNNRVNTVVRLIHTTKPNYTLDRFVDNAEMTEIERAPDILELSCTCSDKKDAPPHAIKLLMEGLFELGLACNVRHYISTGSKIVQDMSNKMFWQTEELSARKTFDDDSFVALKYPVSTKLHNEFRAYHHFSEPLLTSEEIERCQLKQRILAI